MNDLFCFEFFAGYCSTLKKAMLILRSIEHVTNTKILNLCEGQASLTVSLEDLFDRVDISSTAQVDAQVVFHSGAHDCLKLNVLINFSR